VFLTSRALGNAHSEREKRSVFFDHEYNRGTRIAFKIQKFCFSETQKPDSFRTLRQAVRCFCWKFSAFALSQNWLIADQIRHRSAPKLPPGSKRWHF
jgi:hypothetical protein